MYTGDYANISHVSKGWHFKAQDIAWAQAISLIRRIVVNKSLDISSVTLDVNDRTAVPQADVQRIRNLVTLLGLCLAVSARRDDRVVAGNDITCKSKQFIGPRFPGVPGHMLMVIGAAHVSGHACRHTNARNATHGAGAGENEAIERTWKKTEEFKEIVNVQSPLLFQDSLDAKLTHMKLEQLPLIAQGLVVLFLRFFSELYIEENSLRASDAYAIAALKAEVEEIGPEEVQAMKSVAFLRRDSRVNSLLLASESEWETYHLLDQMLPLHKKLAENRLSFRLQQLAVANIESVARLGPAAAVFGSTMAASLVMESLANLGRTHGKEGAATNPRMPLRPAGPLPDNAELQLRLSELCAHQKKEVRRLEQVSSTLVAELFPLIEKFIVCISKLPKPSHYLGPDTCLVYPLTVDEVGKAIRTESFSPLLAALTQKIRLRQMLLLIEGLISAFCNHHHQAHMHSRRSHVHISTSEKQPSKKKRRKAVSVLHERVEELSEWMQKNLPLTFTKYPACFPNAWSPAQVARAKSHYEFPFDEILVGLVTNSDDTLCQKILLIPYRTRQAILHHQRTAEATYYSAYRIKRQMQSTVHFLKSKVEGFEEFRRSNEARCKDVRRSLELSSQVLSNKDYTLDPTDMLSAASIEVSFHFTTSVIMFHASHSSDYISHCSDGIEYCSFTHDILPIPLVIMYTNKGNHSYG